MAERLVVWFIFSVGIALLPLVFNGFILKMRGSEAGVGIVIRRGELLLITVALCAAAVGELLASSPTLRLLEIITGGGAISVLVLSSLSFAFVSTSYDAKTQRELYVVRRFSMGLFGTALLCSAGCIALAQV